jgi:hypothetical protein
MKKYYGVIYPGVSFNKENGEKRNYHEWTILPLKEDLHYTEIKANSFLTNFFQEIKLKWMTLTAFKEYLIVIKLIIDYI